MAGKAINDGKEKIIGISVARSAAQETEELRRALRCFNQKVHKIKKVDVIVDDSYLCDGYGTYNYLIEKTIQQQLACNGMPLDPTYTGKAFWGMQEYLKKNRITGKKILFIHTGGTPLFFDYMKGIQLREVLGNSAVTEAVKLLEGMLVPSLTERNVNLVQYATKLSVLGKVWCHYDMGNPVSIVAGYFNDKTFKTAYLSMLAVDKEYQGKRLGYSLLSAFENYAYQNEMEYVKLEVRKNNLTARFFYKKLGYEIIGEASPKSFYMRKKLNVDDINGGKKTIKKLEDLIGFLYGVNGLFPKPLSKKEDLTILASKFVKYGTISCIRENGRIIALCAGYINDKEKQLGYISVVAVLPEYAGKGYGKVVVRDFLEKAKNAGMQAVHLYADTGNRGALKMYERIGFCAWLISEETRPLDKHLIKYL